MRFYGEHITGLQGAMAEYVARTVGELLRLLIASYRAGRWSNRWMRHPRAIA
jgi:hypothetical protein